MSSLLLCVKLTLINKSTRENALNSSVHLCNGEFYTLVFKTVLKNLNEAIIFLFIYFEAEFSFSAIFSRLLQLIRLIK